MRKLLTLFTLLTALLWCLPAKPVAPQESDLTIRTLFVDSDCPALDILSKSTRMDMADYAEAGQEYSTVNSMYGNSSIKSFSPMYMNVHLSGVSEAELFLLPAAKNYLGAVIYTVDAGGADSQLFMYNANLQPLNVRKYFNPPLIRDFIAPALAKSKDAIREVEQTIPFTALKYSYDPEAQNLRVTLSLEGIISKEDLEKVSKYFEPATPDKAPSLLYRWNGKKFIRVQ